MRQMKRMVWGGWTTPTIVTQYAAVGGVGPKAVGAVGLRENGPGLQAGFRGGLEAECRLTRYLADAPKHHRRPFGRLIVCVALCSLHVLRTGQWVVGDTKLE